MKDLNSGNVRQVNLTRYMDRVNEYRESLMSLQKVWDTLDLLGQMSGSGMDMAGTRQDFQGLSSDLLNELSRETTQARVQGLTGKAQVAIDILVRNLFERTADIGFLATDRDIREYIQLCNVA